MKQDVLNRPCPSCGSAENTAFLTTKDFMITKESFTIVRCSACGFHFTNPIPSKETIGSYYKSEEYVSHSSSKKGLTNWLYNKVRTYTLKQKVKLVQKHTKGTSLLDIGSGTGHFLNATIQAGFKATGLEPDEDAVKFAKSEFGLDLQEIQNLYTLPDKQFDVLTMWHVLEHVYDLKEDIEQISRVMKDDAVLFIAVPNMNSWDANTYGAFWAAYDLPRHLYHFQENTIKDLFAQQNWSLVEIVPMKFDAYYVSMLSEKYKNGSIVSALLNGFKSNRNAKTHGYSSQIYVFKRRI